MVYRTRTYLAGDWTGDQNAIQQLKNWNQSEHLNLTFTDAHELTQARDSSLNCSIKASLDTRLNASKTFVLVVGKNTSNLKSGGCQYCERYNSSTSSCASGYSVDYRGYVDYECEKAVRDGLKIIVLYNSTSVNKNLCPDAVKTCGVHIPMHVLNGGKVCWDYTSVRDALMS